MISHGKSGLRPGMNSYAINMVQFIYKTTGKVVYVTLSSAGSEDNTFLCNIQVY